MKARLIKIETDPEEDVETGTCELCFGTTDLVNPSYTFEIINKDNKKYEAWIDGTYWSYGDVEEVTIENVVDFNAWLVKQTLPEITDIKDFDYSWLSNLVDDYYDFLNSED